MAGPRARSRNNTTGAKGVCWVPSRWRANRGPGRYLEHIQKASGAISVTSALSRQPANRRTFRFVMHLFMLGSGLERTVFANDKGTEADHSFGLVSLGCIVKNLRGVD